MRWDTFWASITLAIRPIATTSCSVISRRASGDCQQWGKARRAAIEGSRKDTGTLKTSAVSSCDHQFKRRATRRPSVASCSRTRRGLGRLIRRRSRTAHSPSIPAPPAAAGSLIAGRTTTSSSGHIQASQLATGAAAGHYDLLTNIAHGSVTGSAGRMSVRRGERDDDRDAAAPRTVPPAGAWRPVALSRIVMRCRQRASDGRIVREVVSSSRFDRRLR